MLKLIKCEFLKLKRKKFIPLIILAAFLFPIPLTYLMTTPSMMERYTDQADAFDGLFNMVLGYGIQFLLPCIIGVIAASRCNHCFCLWIWRDVCRRKYDISKPLSDYRKSRNGRLP